MMRHTALYLVRVAAVAGFLFVPGSALLQTATAQTVEKHAAASPAKAQALKGSKGIANPVTVHGHWAITVKNADGTRASHEEFENSLTSNGAAVLVSLLSGQAIPNSYAIGLTDGNVTGVCGKTICNIVVSANSGLGPDFCSRANNTCTTSLAETVAGSTLQFSGQIQAVQAGAISGVATFVAVCSNTAISVQACAAVTPATTLAFTSTDATTNPAFAVVRVNSGQIVQVTVTLSFS